MNKVQYIFILVFIALFGIIYFGLDLTPPNFGSVELTRSLEAVNTDIAVLKQEAYDEMPQDRVAFMKVLEQEGFENGEDGEVLKTLASNWYQEGYPHISAHYAELIAEQQKDEESWAMSGTSYLLGLRNSQDDKVREFCRDKSLASLENAISLNPNNVDHRINQALVNVEMPPENNPMKGILMLVDLNKKNPDNIKVLNQLGRLALKTNQFEKARTRFESVVSLQPENEFAVCSLVNIYEQMGEEQAFREFLEKCNSIKK